MPRIPSKPEIELAKELERRDCDVSPRQVARWREAKIIKPDRGWPGGGGSESGYSAEMIDLAIALDEVLRQRRSLRDAVLILYARGWPLEPAVVKRALLEYLDRVEAALTKAVSKAQTPEAVRASLSMTKEGRAMLRHLDDAGLDEMSFVKIVLGLVGQREGWVGDLLSASAFDVIAASILDDATRKWLEEMLGQFTIPAISSAVEAAAPEQLGQALEDSRSILPFVSTFTELLARFANEPGALLLKPETELDAELDTAHWTAIAIWARSQFVDLDAGAVLADQYAAGTAAALELASQFSYARGPLFGPDSESELAKLHDYERESVVERIQDWLVHEPEQAEAIRSLASSH